MLSNRRATAIRHSYAELDAFDEDQLQHLQQRRPYRRRRRRRNHHNRRRHPVIPDPPLNHLSNFHPQNDTDENSSGTDPEVFDEFVAAWTTTQRDNDGFDESSLFADLFDARKDVECPICLGILNKTRAVMGCMHRFCKDCIHKSMRLGNNECPACRMHCASRRSLRDDPLYDTFIHSVYPDVQNYEEQELVLGEEDRQRNKETQASIAQISKLQAQALGKKRRTLKLKASTTSRVSQYPNQAAVLTPDETSDIILGLNLQEDGGSIGANVSTTACNVNMLNPVGEDTSVVPSLLRYQEKLITWGGAGTRSHTRNGGASTSSRSSSVSRLTRLTESLQRSTQKEVEEFEEVHLRIFPMDEKRSPSLRESYLCCHQKMGIKALGEHIAGEIMGGLQGDDVRLLIMLSRADNSSTSLVELDGQVETLADLCKFGNPMWKQKGEEIILLYTWA